MTKKPSRASARGNDRATGILCKVEENIIPGGGERVGVSERLKPHRSSRNGLKTSSRCRNKDEGHWTRVRKEKQGDPPGKRTGKNTRVMFCSRREATQHPRLLLGSMSEESLKLAVRNGRNGQGQRGGEIKSEPSRRGGT